ncbi:MAG: hypothetical protein H5T96_09420 [Tissierellales bacterium]|nr:hypothetical protein [Tissierellales bacterium]
MIDKDNNKCNLISSCGNQKWELEEITGLQMIYKCRSCGGVKKVFRNIYPGYYEKD